MDDEDAEHGSRMALSLNRYLLGLPELGTDKFERERAECLVYGQYDYDKLHPAQHKVPLTVPLCILADVRLRFLCPDDLEEVRELCKDWFPIGK